MFIEFSPEQTMFRETIREFAQKEIDPLVDEAEEQERFPVPLFPRMGGLGYLCVSYPARYGAGELGKVGDCLEIEEIACICSGIASAIMVQGGIGTALLARQGTEEQKQRYLVPAIAGEKIAAFALTEPNAGSDATAIETTAVRDGRSYVINGTKMFITNGPIADFVVVMTYTDKAAGPRRGMSAFVVDKGTPGFAVTRKLSKVGNRSAETGELAFQDCRVPEENRLGEEGEGFQYMLATLARGRVSHAARSIGVAQAAFEASLAYSRERVQFGQPIGKFQAIRFKLAQMATNIEAARWLMYRAAWLMDNGQERMREVAMAKLFASEVAVEVVGEAMQIHGGYGYMSEHRVQRYFRDARLFTITEGTSEMQQVIIARELGI